MIERMSARSRKLIELWRSDLGRSLVGDFVTQAVATYLVYGPQRNALGLYTLVLGRMGLGGEIGCGEKDALRTLQRLSEEEFAYYDVKSETVWVPTMAASAFGVRMTIADNRVSEPEESKGHRHHKT